MMSSSTVSRYRESSAVTSPVKLYDQKNSSFTEDYALDAIAKEAELRLQHQRDQNREARHIRYRELEKTARDINDEDDSPTIPFSTSISIKDKTSLSLQSGISTNNTLLLQKFLNGDIDLRSIEQRDLRRLLIELESRYKSLMILNASISNEKQAFIHQIESYKDQFDEHFETFNQIKRQLKEKNRDFEFEKQIRMNVEQLNHHFQETFNRCEQLIEEFQNQEMFFSNQTIDEKFRRILQQNSEQIKELTKLKSDFDEQQQQQQRSFSNQNETYFHSKQENHFDEIIQRNEQLIKELTDWKNRSQRFEAENNILQQENKRYEAQLTRYKQQLEDAEQVEDELKQERRRLQRELRSIRDDLETERTRVDVLQHENTRLRTKNLLSNPDDIHSNSPTTDST